MSNYSVGREIPLGHGRVALVDDEDWEFVSRWTWHRGGPGYAMRNAPRGETHYMHRLLLDAPAGVQVDHRNGDRLDNRRSNLRLATNGENACNQGLRSDNTSGYRGVTFHRFSGLWHAVIQKDGKVHSLGYHKTPEQAAQARAAVVDAYHGEFAHP